MNRLQQKCFLSISLLFATMHYCGIQAQVLFPSSAGERVKSTVYIEMPKGYISGVCVLQNEGDTVRGIFFNEFGITVMAFSYDLRKNKIKLFSTIKMLSKWYIKKVLRKDLVQVMLMLQKGERQFTNKRFHITYQFSPISEALQQNGTTQDDR